MPADLLIVGAGPAGLATAIHAASRGAQVTVLDRRRPPLDKACGEGLMPSGVRQLAALGLTAAQRLGRPFRGIRYVDGERVVDGDFPRGTGLGVRRLELHRALVDRAAALGVDLRWGVETRALVEGGVETSAGRLAGDVVVGADGLHSRVRAWTGLAGGAARLRRFGVRRHYAVRPWTDRVEVHWAAGAEAYVTPVSEQEVGIAILWSGGRGGFDRLLQSFPRLRDQVAGRAVLSQDRGAGPLRQRVRGVVRDRVALVGDASGYIDAITGEGLSLAFGQAEALVGAVERGDLHGYAREHRRIGRWPDRLTRGVLALERHPRLRQVALGLLAARPGLFSAILGVMDHGVGVVGEPREPQCVESSRASR